MPIYPQSDVPPSVMDNALQAPTGFDVSLPEGTNPEPQQQQPSVWDAAFRQNNLLAGMFRPAKQFEPAEGITLILIKRTKGVRTMGIRLCGFTIPRGNRPD